MKRLNTTLFDLLKNVDIDITNKIIDNSWHKNMTEIIKNLIGGFFKDTLYKVIAKEEVHEEYCNKFVKKNNLV